MIEMLIGRVVAHHRTHSTILLDSGVGYGVTLHDRDQPRAIVADRVTLHCREVARKDQLPCLAGFLDEGDRLAFDALLTIKGFGPGTAIKLLSSLTPAEIKAAQQTGDHARLKKIVGDKTAMKLIAAAP